MWDSTALRAGWHRLASWAVVAVVGLFPFLTAESGILPGSESRRYAWAVLLAVVALGLVESRPARRRLRGRVPAWVLAVARIGVVGTLVVFAAALADGWSSPLLFLLTVPLVDAAVGLWWQPTAVLVVVAVATAGGAGLVTPDVAVIWLVAVLGPVGLAAVAGRGRSIEAARGAESRSRATRRAELLNVIAATDLTSHGIDTEQVTAAVVSGTLGLGVAAAAFYEIDADEGVLRLGEAAGLSLPAAARQGRLDAENALCRAVRSGTAVVSAGNASDLPKGSADAGLRSVWVVPVFLGDDVAGVLCALDRDLRVPEAGELVALQVLAGRIAWGMTSARQLAEKEDMIDRLQEAERLKADFVSTISHELRTPATVIKGANELLFTAWDRLPAATRDELRVRIDRNADRFASLLDTLLAYRELDAGRLQPEPEPVELSRIIEDVRRDVAGRDDVDEGGITWDVDDLMVLADPRQIRRVLLILIDNAVVHTPPGTSIMVRGQRENDDVVVTVSDSGPGIDPSLLAELRRPFARAGDVLTRNTGGVGLGLAIADRILAGHGRHLSIEGTQGSGTSCSFRLPLEDSRQTHLITLPELEDVERGR